MRVSILLLCTAFACQGVHAQVLSDMDREALLDNLEKLRDNAESQRDDKYRVALTAYRNAVGSDQSTMELYLACLEKVNFQDQKKKALEFREWKREEGEKLSDPSFRAALRHQLRWLILTLQAASLNSNRSKNIADAQQAMDMVFAEADSLKGQGAVLSQSVTGTVFATAYDIRNVKADAWALSPIDVATIYDKIVLPPLRNPSHLPQLRAAWTKRIQQEIVKQEHLANSKRREENRRDENGRDKRGDEEENHRIGMADAMQSPEYQKFIADEVPKLQWEMEVDLFKSGDESNAAAHMLAHLQKNIRHPSAREWADQLKVLLNPKVAVPLTTP